MSADNGIYILESPTDEGREYRVLHAQGIENIEFDPDREGFNTNTLRDYFGDCQPVSNEDEAMALARDLEQKILNDDFCPVLEYGINSIRLPFPFPGKQQLIGPFDLKEIIGEYSDSTSPQEQALIIAVTGLWHIGRIGEGWSQQEAIRKINQIKQLLKVAESEE